MLLDNLPFRIEDLDIRKRGSQIMILHPGMTLGIMEITSGEPLVSILLSKVDQMKRSKKILRKLKNNLTKSEQTEHTEDLLKLLMELDKI